MNKIFPLILILVTILLSCNNKPIEYKYYRCEIDSIEQVHWWSGYYKSKIYYHFNYQDTVISDIYFDEKIHYSWSANYVKGDSAIVGYNDSLKVSKLIKRTYILKNNYHTP
jgi:hypothetical protein